MFVVNTVSLVTQQSAFIARHTGLKCKGYSGDMQVDYWSEDQWMDEIKNHEVFNNILSSLYLALFIILIT